MNERQWPSILKKGLVFALWLLPALCALQVIWTHWVAVPFWDEWDTPGAQLASYYRGTLNFAELFSQHNEHRLLFPRLVWLPMAILAGWDVRHEMLLTLCLVGLCSAGLYRLLHFSNGPAAGRALVFGLMNLLLFSPRQYETFLVGAQGQTFVPTFALIFRAADESVAKVAAGENNRERGARVRRHLLIWKWNAALAAGVSVGDAAGVQPSGAHRTRPRLFWRAVYLLIAAVSVASYFISYRHPPYSPPVVSPLERFRLCPLRRRLDRVVVRGGRTRDCGTLLLLLLVGPNDSGSCARRDGPGRGSLISVASSRKLHPHLRRCRFAVAPRWIRPIRWRATRATRRSPPSSTSRCWDWDGVSAPTPKRHGSARALPFR